MARRSRDWALAQAIEAECGVNGEASGGAPTMEEGRARRGWRDPGAGSPDPVMGEVLGLIWPASGGGRGSAMAEVGYLRERERR